MKENLRLQTFKDWVHRLNWRQLHHAMEFEFVCEPNHYNNSTSTTGAVSSSIEEDLLREMIKLQVPPPPPIHPRALSFRPASCLGATDGQNESDRISRCRYRRPRLFQWIERRSAAPLSQPPLLPRRRKNGRNTNTSLSGSTSNSRGRRFDVIARRWVTADGERLSVGCTKEERELDDMILSGTSLVSLPSASGNTVASTTSCTVGRFVSESKIENDTRKILRMLHVASRGRFLSCLPSDNNRTSLPYVAPWLDTTQRWFSLSMYLASRFEMALWTSFCNQRCEISLTAALLPVPSNITHDTVISLVGKALSETLVLEILPDDASKLGHLLDSALWDLLESAAALTRRRGMELTDRSLKGRFRPSVSSILDKLMSCPLVQVGSQEEDVRRRTVARLHAVLLKEIEKTVLEDLLGSTETKTKPEQVPKPSRNRKKSKRKNRKKKTTIASAVSELPPQAKPDDGEVLSSDEGGEREKSGQSKPGILFRENHTNPRDRNRNIITAMSILEDVVEDVFVRVGLSNDAREQNGDTATGQRCWIRAGEKQERGASETFKASGSDVKKGPIQQTQSRGHSSVHGARKPSQLKRSDFNLTPMRQTKINDVCQQKRQPLPTRQTRVVVAEKQGQLLSGAPVKGSKNVSTKEYPSHSQGSGQGNQVRVQICEPDRHTKVPASQRWNRADSLRGQSIPKAEMERQATVRIADLGQLKPTDASGRCWSPNGEAQGSQWQNNGDKCFSANDASSRNDVEPANVGTPLTAHTSSSAFFEHYGKLAGGFFRRTDVDFAWGMTESALDDWGRVQGFGSRDRSILSEFFQDRSESSKAEMIMASSTAASIASSSDKHESDAEANGDGFVEHDEELHAIHSSEFINPKSVAIAECSGGVEVIVERQNSEDDPVQSPNLTLGDPAIQETSSVTEADFDSRSVSPQAPSTPSPTLSPILVSLADLKDLRRGRSSTEEPSPLTTARSFSSVTATSLPNSPQRSSPRPRMVSCLSRDNLRGAVATAEKNTQDAKKISPRSTEIPPSPRPVPLVGSRPAKSRDDHDIRGKASLRRSIDALSSYRNAAMRPAKTRDDHDIKQNRGLALRSTTAFSPYRNMAIRASARSASSIKTAGSESSMKPFTHLSLEPSQIEKGREGSDLCARSDIAIDRHDDYQTYADSRRNATDDADNNTVTKDGSTTITSALSHREPEEIATLREERNTYRDLCLTLGAEVAKLKNMLAAQRGTAVYPALDFSQHFVHPVNNVGAFDPESISHFMRHAPRAQTLAAMSDAGYRAEHESLASEDDVAAKMLMTENARHASSGATIAGSDISLEHNSSNILQLPGGLPLTRDLQENASLNGMQSRLARDILQFLHSTSSSLKKLDTKRQAAVERMDRLVKTVWPRAQVKLYGSHVTGLCLPSSDLDFIVCLPAVQKNAPAVAPGPLEGRNAINETSQKLLSRKLKGESWIDPRSMKLIERTVVPVIKVATKDTRARTLHLDITFDGPGHHGLEAVHMVNKIMEELPMLRPLVLVLKQFLLDRGLLTAYTGGLSSHCLFLMVARYLQEQPSSWGGDCGSLLMGFLDYYGNHFDPRTTGISVRRRQYFARPNYAAVRTQTVTETMWTTPHSHVGPTPTSVGVGGGGTAGSQFFRRNSFSSEKGIVDARGANLGMAGTALARPPRFQAGTPPTGGYLSAEVPTNLADQYQHQADQNGMPYTFDPLFVEDPLSAGNNVGRNAFRVVQVQRAFSDAHRALVAALEWDMHSTGELQDGCEYTLLKCLLQSEDIVWEL